MLDPHFIKNIIRSRLTLISSNNIITIKIDVKNYKKINKQKDYLKFFSKWAVKWTQGKQTQIMRWEIDNLQIFPF